MHGALAFQVWQAGEKVSDHGIVDNDINVAELLVPCMHQLLDLVYAGEVHATEQYSARRLPIRRDDWGVHRGGPLSLLFLPTARGSDA